jgi:hypothetical protein
MLHCVLKGFNFPLITSLSKVAKFCGFHLFFVVGKLTKVLINPRDIHYIWGIFSSNALLWLLFVAPVTNAPENRLNFDPSFFVCHMFVTKTHFRRITYTPWIFMTQFSVRVVGDLRTLGANTWCASCVCTVEVKRHPKMQGLDTTSVLFLGQTIIFLYLQEPSHIATDIRNIALGKGRI